MISFLFIFLCLFLKLLVDDYNKPIISEVDQLIINLTYKKPIYYISNGVVINTTLNRYYCDILELGNDYDIDQIITQVKKQKSYYQEDVSLGYKVRYSTMDIILAETYLFDNYNYLVNLN